MDINNLIQLGAVLVAIFSLVWQQSRLVREEQLKEKRIDTKLRIFYILTDKARDLKEEEIITALEKGQPLSDVDKNEIRKSLYEMLKDETVRFTYGKKYKPRKRSESDEP